MVKLAPPWASRIKHGRPACTCSLGSASAAAKLRCSDIPKGDVPRTCRDWRDTSAISRHAQPEDIGRIAAFLASADSRMDGRRNLAWVQRCALRGSTSCVQHSNEGLIVETNLNKSYSVMVFDSGYSGMAPQF